MGETVINEIRRRSPRQKTTNKAEAADKIGGRDVVDKAAGTTKRSSARTQRSISTPPYRARSSSSRDSESQSGSAVSATQPVCSKCNGDHLGKNCEKLARRESFCNWCGKTGHAEDNCWVKNHCCLICGSSSHKIIECSLYAPRNQVLADVDDNFLAVTPALHKRSPGSHNPEGDDKSPLLTAKHISLQKCPRKLEARLARAHRHREGDSVNSVWTIVSIGALVLTIAFLIIMSTFVSPELNKMQDNKSLGEIEDEIVKELASLQARTKQERRFWGEITSSVRGILEEDVKQPSVLLLAVASDAVRTAVCLSHHITDIVVKAFNDERGAIKHDTLEYTRQSWSEHKLTLDTLLQGLSHSHAAVIYNVELLPARTAALLHGYCDNDNAPFKRSVLLLLLELGQHYDTISPNLLDLTVERRLHSLWGPYMDADHIPGLVSRVAGQPVLVKPESETSLDYLCPL